jgi:hypothetical protein
MRGNGSGDIELRETFKVTQIMMEGRRREQPQFEGRVSRGLKRADKQKGPDSQLVFPRIREVRSNVATIPTATTPE